MSNLVTLEPLQPSKMVGTMPRGAKVASSSSVTTLPRSSKTGNHPHSKHVYHQHHRQHQLQPQPLMMSTPRSGSRESGSSSSRTVSRSGSRCALSKSGSRSGSSSALQKARPGTPEGNFINHGPGTLFYVDVCLCSFLRYLRGQK